MKEKEYKDLVNKIDSMREAIHSRKCHDYADDADVLSNFKRVSTAARSLCIDVKTSEGYAMFMLLMKIDRLNNLVSNSKEPLNEATIDTVVDAHNYLDLAYACLIEKGGQ